MGVVEVLMVTDMAVVSGGMGDSRGGGKVAKVRMIAVMVVY